MSRKLPAVRLYRPALVSLGVSLSVLTSPAMLAGLALLGSVTLLIACGGSHA